MLVFQLAHALECVCGVLRLLRASDEPWRERQLRVLKPTVIREILCPNLCPK
jgi:hypothetical protein